MNHHFCDVNIPSQLETLDQKRGKELISKQRTFHAALNKNHFAESDISFLFAVVQKTKKHVF